MAGSWSSSWVRVWGAMAMRVERGRAALAHQRPWSISRRTAAATAAATAPRLLALHRATPAPLPFLLLLSGAAAAASLNIGRTCLEAATDPIAEADRLYAQGKTEELYAHLTRYVEANPSDGAALWRLARACHDLSLLKKDKEEKKKLIYQAHDLAKRALEAAPSDFSAHKWAGITLSSLGDYEGTKIQISNAFIIREHFEKAISLNPRDATSRHLLGVWCFTIADMSWFVAKVATALFATPPSSSYQESLDHFLSAEALEPGFYKKNATMIGKVLLRLKRNDEAKAWLQKALALPTNNPDDEEAHKEAATLLKGL